MNQSFRIFLAFPFIRTHVYHQKVRKKKAGGTKATKDRLRREDHVASDKWGSYRRKKIKRGVHESAESKEILGKQ